MSTVVAIYENGIFRPLEKVDLAEHARVELTLRQTDGDQPPMSPALAAVYEVLSRRFRSGERDLAARHNEHQP